MSLRDRQTLVLFGKWGSGKRTLAKQIASKLAIEEGLKIKVVRHFVSISDDLASTCSTILILDNPFKSLYTSSHNSDIFDFLFQLRANAKGKKCFLLILFHCDDIYETGILGLDAEIRNISKLFPKNLVVRISFPIETLTQIAQRKKDKISIENLRKTVENIAENNSSSGMCHTLPLVLFLKSQFYEHREFLKDPITFVLNKLEEIAMSQNFTTLVWMILHTKEFTKTEVKAIFDPALSGNINEGTDIGDLTDGCIQQLLQSYITKNRDGKSYSMIHDVITRCVLYTALKCDSHRNLVYRECDSLLLLDCVRPKTDIERFRYPKKFIFDRKTFDIGLPTETFPALAKSFVDRNEMMTMLGNVRLMEDKRFQSEWHRANGGHNKPKELRQES